MIYHPQQGAALVVAMLILSLVTVFAASMAFDYQFSIRRVSNQMTMQEAYGYLRATEVFAAKALMQDLQNDSDDDLTVDHRGELWAEEGMTFVLENGAYTGQLEDLQGRFNINSLLPPSLEPGEFPPAVPYTISQGIFIRLLQTLADEELQVTEEEAKAITEAILDWMDEDNDPRGFSCGEDDSYYRIEGRQPHRVANGPMASVTELRLICNMPMELYRRLRPHVTVWPLSGDTSININTAKSPVLRSIFVDEGDVERLQQINNKTSYQVPPPLDEAAVNAIVQKTAAEELDDGEQRFDLSMVEVGEEAVGYNSLSAVLNDLSGSLTFWPGADLGLYSNYFLLEAVAELNDLTQSMSSVISRKDGKIEVLARSTGGL